MSLPRLMTCDCSDLMESLLFLLNEELYVKDLCIGPPPPLRLWESERSKDSDCTRLMALMGILVDTAELLVELVCREVAGQERVLVILLREFSLVATSVSSRLHLVEAARET